MLETIAKVVIWFNYILAIIALLGAILVAAIPTLAIQINQRDRTKGNGVLTIFFHLVLAGMLIYDKAELLALPLLASYLVGLICAKCFIHTLESSSRRK